MKSLAFFSNFLNHHQLPFCLEMRRLLGDGYRFIATEPTPRERLAMGYSDMSHDYDFVVRSYESNAWLDEARRWANDSDVVVIGSAPDCFIRDRIRKNRLTLRYSERIFKRGRWRLLSPRAMASLAWAHTRHRWNKCLHLLCAGAYSAGDYAMIGAYPRRKYKWGYFPTTSTYGVDALLGMKNSQPRLSLLWAGRLISWKHPELALLVACHLKKHSVDFDLRIAGCGDMDEALKQQTHALGVDDVVTFLGPLSNTQVRQQMDRAHIFLFTSDYNEGWGAVLNEAMSSACLTIASSAIGAVHFLLKDGRNGAVYRYEAEADLCRHALFYAKNAQAREEKARAAYQTIHDTWNASVAAERLVELCKQLLVSNQSPVVREAGPCSYAE